MQELIDKVRELVAFELERANTIHPPKFNSYHEAYAVILEEMEEAKEEWERICTSIESAWQEIKDDVSPEEIDNWLETAEHFAVHTAAEMIQVAAMCRKARM